MRGGNSLRALLEDLLLLTASDDGNQRLILRVCRESSEEAVTLCGQASCIAPIFVIDERQYKCPFTGTSRRLDFDWRGIDRTVTSNREEKMLSKTLQSIDELFPEVPSAK